MKKITIALILLLWAVPAQAKTSVFELQCKGSTLYLGGTVHVLKESDFPLPDAYQQAYKKADTLVFEVDLNAMKQGEVMGKMLTAMQYQDGRTLKKVLQKDTYELLSTRAQALNIDLEILDGFRPAALITMMMSMELKKMGVKEGGVDAHFFTKAMLDDKKIVGLESIDKQFELLGNMGEGNEDEFIRGSLDDFNNMQESWEDITQAWRNGDMEGIERKAIDQLKEFPSLYQSMLVDRNRDWIPHILEFFTNDQLEFILVGAAHLAGKDGLLAQLEQHGCNIKQM